MWDLAIDHTVFVLIDKRPDAGPGALFLDAVHCNVILCLFVVVVVVVCFAPWSQPPFVGINNQQSTLINSRDEKKRRRKMTAHPKIKAKLLGYSCVDMDKL
jgi:hypothetical protein